MTRRTLALSLLLAALPAEAHDSGAASAQAGWSWDLWITGPLALILLVYLAGWARLRGRASGGRSRLARSGQVFLIGWAILAGALVSPLHQLGERSFTAHMIEHELLMLVAAPLLVWGRPGATLLWGLPKGLRRLVGRTINAEPASWLWRAATAPVFATILQAAVLWLWHSPALFDRALDSEAWHAAQHLCFIVAGLLFWTAMLARGTPKATAVLCLFATSVVSGALGALMAFAASPWYAPYAALGMAPFGLSPAQDQQLAGVLMWVPGGMVHAGAALALLYAMLAEEETPAHAR